MRIAIVGSRDYPDLAQVAEFVRRFAWKYPDGQIVSGGARGVDITAEQAAEEWKMSVRSYRPKRRGRSYYVVLRETGRFQVAVKDGGGQIIHYPDFRSAAFARNGWIVTDADRVVAFWNGRSTGTADTISRTRDAGKPLHIYEPGSPLSA